MHSHMCRQWLLGGLIRGMWAVGWLMASTSNSQETSPPPCQPKHPHVVWMSHYGEALQMAEREKKMLLLVFHRSEIDAVDKHFQNCILSHPEIQERLTRYVCARLPVDTRIRFQGKTIVLMEHPAFAPMAGHAGVVVIDYAHPEASYYGCVVGAFPFAADACYSVDQMKVILDLPAGQLAQRQQWYVERMRRWAEQFLEKAPKRLPPLRWYNDYRTAYQAAYQSRRMLLILFADPGDQSLGNRFEKEILSDPAIQEKLADYVLAKLPRDARLQQQGESVVLLEHPAFAEMLGLEGVAIVDLAHEDQKQYGTVVSVFPFLNGQLYTLEQTLVMLSLPPGTLTQRTLIYAVRIHPERPASTTGQFDPLLAQEAENHSAYQARIRLQGHHHWNVRFQRISQLLPGGLLAQEVCAESWPGQNLLEAALECVRSWRLSSGHWSAVRAAHPRYGYDMKKGDNGVWYATGIFARSVR
ncbi:MAG: thioredoxin family protein [Thermoguttaceae bacterium]|nr:thioredoxin family protein [Thermoguttaceae bacterium]MDW8038520.1 hypothetical protein [Thermoguttaceae bacterium]